MVDEKILKLREELNNSIKYEKDYEKIYKLSIDLDRLITEYYNAKLKQMMKVWEKFSNNPPAQYVPEDYCYQLLQIW